MVGFSLTTINELKFIIIDFFPFSEAPEESASNQLQRQFLSSVPQIDANALNDIELEAQYLAANIDGITENLCNLLHSVGFDLKPLSIGENYNFIRF